MKAEVKIPKGYRRLRRNEKLHIGDWSMLGTWQVGVGMVWSEWTLENYAYVNPAHILCIRKVKKSRKP